MSENLKAKISNKSARIGVIGLGYVGLPLAVEFAKKGFDVIGIDIDENRVASINNGENYIKDVDDSELDSLVSSKSLTATTDYHVIANLDSVLICVPTPLSKLRDPDLSFITSVLDKLVNLLHKDLLIILESTTYPGTTKELVLPKLSESGLKVGEDFYLCFSPERIDPGNTDFGIHNTPKVVGGISEKCLELGTTLYEQIVNEVIPVSSTESAEMVKLLENTYRSINIGLVNEIALMCEKLNADVWEVIDAAATKPFGFMKFTPGPGLGGHCIPVDPHYLAWKMKTLDYDARFIRLAGEINTAMPGHVVNLIASGLNRQQRSINGSKILLVGIAYKKDINDVRESPALDVLKLLEDQQAIVDYYDPYVPSFVWDSARKKGLVSLEVEALGKYDAVVILTDHTGVDYEGIRNYARLIIDARNVYPMNNDDHIVRLGVG